MDYTDQKNEITQQILESQEVKDFIGDLVEEKLKEADKVKPVGFKYYVPKYREMYYFIDDEGNVDESAWFDDVSDRWRLLQHNIFRTRERAEYHKRMLDLKAELKVFAGELSKDNPVDWNNGHQVKYSLCFNFSEKCILGNTVHRCKGFNIYYTYSDFKEKAIEKFGEETLREILTYEGYL